MGKHIDVMTCNPKKVGRLALSPCQMTWAALRPPARLACPPQPGHPSCQI